MWYAGYGMCGALGRWVLGDAVKNVGGFFVRGHLFEVGECCFVVRRVTTTGKSNETGKVKVAPATRPRGPHSDPQVWGGKGVTQREWVVP